ncbi:IS4 family transposase [Virgibacillus salarius]|uniref:IS4 family transposase n=1 Tax=Virgibacillus salarius TaxID=447199 RepID=UPI002493820A|nr:IS4 family transposase [Virgibacillus salarius]WBX81476.1 IS4 family transposase [Virgibacillus salarius]WBX81853.1 IS4 family transposase [Virgibacillus salarius]
MAKQYHFDSFVKSVHDILSISELRNVARESGFVQRLKKIMPEDFLSICAFLHEKVGTEGLGQLCASLSRESEISISKQALHQRLDEKGVAFLKQVFMQLAEKQQMLSLPSPSDYPFSRIRILDGTSFQVKKNTASYWDGVKIQLEYELYQGNFLHTLFYRPRDSDHDAAEELADTIGEEDLILRDLGYFSGDHFKKIDRAGAYYITRVPANMTYWTLDDKQRRIQIKPEEDAMHLAPGEIQDYGFIQLGVKGKNTFHARVVVQRLTEEQQKQRDTYLKERRRKGGHTQSANKKNHIQILATNITQEEMDEQTLYPIYSLRWQVEILFKTWKSLFEIDDVQAMNTDRFYCHLYGILIHILLSSMIAFQCRYCLYEKYQLEGSEYKCINHARNAIVETKGYSLYHLSSLKALIDNIYQNIYRHGRKDHRCQHKSPFDVLNIAYKVHFRAA